MMNLHDAELIAGGHEASRRSLAADAVGDTSGSTGKLLGRQVSLAKHRGRRRQYRYGVVLGLETK
jgi:hypothetical protein